uniref:ANK_REP_REGION domain-containing protein n=1 Tax=Macrostomum lignano TaxID=282301 RepID=A0A1I8IM42_9PLAT
AADLAEAVRSGDAGRVRDQFLSNHTQVRLLVERDRLLHHGVPPNLAAPNSGRRPLHEAVSAGFEPVVRELLPWIEKQQQQQQQPQADGGINAVDNRGRSAVHAACEQGELACLNLLAAAGASLNLPDSGGVTPAHLAAGRDHPELLKRLRKRCGPAAGNALMSARDGKGLTPAHWAAASGATRALHALASELKAPVDLPDRQGNQPAHLAARHDRLNCLRLLADRGVALDLPGRAGKLPLHFPRATRPATGRICPQAECFACWLRHGGDSELANLMAENCAQAARRAGHPVLMATVVKQPTDNAAKSPSCPLCVEKDRKWKWEQAHQSAPVLRAMGASARRVYTDPLGDYRANLNRRSQDSRGLRSAGAQAPPLKPRLR